MGLAALGDPSRFKLEKVLGIHEDGRYNFDERIYSKYKVTQQESYFSNYLEGELNYERRRPGQEFEQQHIDMAASVQFFYENRLAELLKYAVDKYRSEHIYMAGGTALNCLANFRMRERRIVKSVTIQPASSDRGLGMGCAVYGAKKRNINFKLGSFSLGQEYDEKQTIEKLNKLGLKFKRHDDLSKQIAADICNNKVVGLHQGKSEYGPRALGNRSILANPLVKDIKSVLNRKIKFREGYRPFAVFCIEEDISAYFKNAYPSRYMTDIFEANNMVKLLMPGIVHNDKTCRVQTVGRTDDELIKRLLFNFKRNTGHSCIINTSFNRNGEPIVETPEDAIRTFFTTGLDKLYIGNIEIMKAI